jgi:hypothetical protein
MNAEILPSARAQTIAAASHISEATYVAGAATVDSYPHDPPTSCRVCAKNENPRSLSFMHSRSSNEARDEASHRNLTHRSNDDGALLIYIKGKTRSRSNIRA